MSICDWLTLYVLLSPFEVLIFYFVGHSRGYDECEKKMIAAKLRQEGIRDER